MKISAVWGTMNPKYKRIFAVSAIAGAAMLAMSMFTGPKQQEQPRTTKETIKSVLTDKSMREVSMDSLSAEIRLLMRKQEETSRDLANMKAQEKRRQQRGGADDEGASADEVKRLRTELDSLIQQMQEQQEKAAEAAQQAPAPAQHVSSLDADPNNPDAVFGARMPAGGYGVEGNDPMAGGGHVGGEQGGGLKIVSYSQSAGGEGGKNTKAASEDDETIYMPAGSILTGVLINGMDAPTGQGARRDPFPSTLRLQKEAVLPNRFRADVRECFLIVSGYGDLSSERAYLRGETISCVREDGGVIEARLNSYAVGEDGKAGVRGRLVSKQGQIIAKSLMAGFLSGAADALNVKQMPMISLTENGTTSANSQYTNTISGELVKGSAFKGASNALERIAQYYVSMAEGIFPVIEVDAGRQLDVIMTSGVKLQVKGKRK